MKRTLLSVKERLASVFSGIERLFSPYMKVGIGLALVATVSTLGYLAFTEKTDITSSTVMITNLTERSGGSGVIISTSSTKSTVLTNGHVCEVVKNGGLVITNKGQKHIVLSYKESQRHDLCLLTVASKLPANITLSGSPPPMYEKAIISGHPALLPNVVTEGHFSGNKVIDIFMGFKPCTAADRKDNRLGFVCLFFGGLPVVKTFEAVLVTATIMPGSSGSAIYNSSKKLSALVFAGSGSIGYAFAVPFEYITLFLDKESKLLPEKYPNYEVDIISLLEDQMTETHRNSDLRRKCETEITDIEDKDLKREVTNICNSFIRNLNWRNQ